MLLINELSDECQPCELLRLVGDQSLGISMRREAECQRMYYQTYRDLKRICQCKVTQQHSHPLSHSN